MHVRINKVRKASDAFQNMKWHALFVQRNVLTYMHLVDVRVYHHLLAVESSLCKENGRYLMRSPQNSAAPWSLLRMVSVHIMTRHVLWWAYRYMDGSLPITALIVRQSGVS